MIEFVVNILQHTGVIKEIKKNVCILKTFENFSLN